MEIRLFTKDDYPVLVAIHTSQNIVWPEYPRSPEAWAEVDQQRGLKYKHQRWVAAEDGKVIAFASYHQPAGDYHPQRFYIHIEVLPEYQRHGIGSALYKVLIDELAQYNPRVLRADAFSNLPQGFAFLQKRGFFEAFRETPVHLDTTSFDMNPHASLEPNLNSQGIFITTVRDLESDLDRDRKLFELYMEVDEDVPHEEAEIEKPSFEEWLTWGLNPATTLTEAYFVAKHGDRYIGLREMYEYRDNTALLGSILGVRREYRGRGIGLALHLRGIQYAKEHGYAQVKTCTAIQNAPMQALFNKLGYARDPEWQQCQKNIEK